MKEIATNQAEIEAVAKLDEEHEFDPTSQTRAFTCARCCRKGPVQAGHVTLSKIFCSVRLGKCQFTCFHIQAIHFKCNERDVIIMVAKNNINFPI